MRSISILALSAALALPACSGTVEPPAACIEDMQRAATITDSAEADPVLIHSLTTCGTADQWLEALRRNPGAMGLNERAEIGDIDLRSACYGNEDTPVCRSWSGS